MAEILRSFSEEDTLGIGRAIGRCLVPPHTVLLIGDLGTGKTVLTKGICLGLGVEDTSLVHSPTFSLVNEYFSPRGPIFHLDLYRLETLRDLYSIGIEDILATEGFIIVEWAEKLQMVLESPTTIRLRSEGSGTVRTLSIEPPLGIEQQVDQDRS